MTSTPDKRNPLQRGFAFLRESLPESDTDLPRGPPGRAPGTDTVAAVGISCPRILGIGLPMYAVGMVMTQALNGAGDTGSPVAMNLLCFWMLQIPLAYWLATGAGMGPGGAFAAIVVPESLLPVPGVIVFRRGRWQTRRV